jgi:hypothetical protein
VVGLNQPCRDSAVALRKLGIAALAPRAVILLRLPGRADGALDAQMQPIAALFDERSSHRLVRWSYRSGALRSILKALLLLSRSPGPLHECLDFFQSEAAIFVGVHGLEDALMRCLELLQRDSPVAVTVHQSEEHPHHHAGM